MFDLESIWKFKLLHANTGAYYTSSSLHIRKHNPPNQQFTRLTIWKKKMAQYYQTDFLLIKLKLKIWISSTTYFLPNYKERQLYNREGCNF